MIDAHLHFVGDHPESVALVREFGLKLLNITVASPSRPWREEEADPYCMLAQKWPDLYAWCTSFEVPSTSQEDPAYTQRVIESLERDFANGAIACKVWKNVGMEAQDETGRYIMVDDPVLEPVFRYLEDKGIPLMMHIAEPLACWKPIDWPSPHQGYYRDFPQWHMHGRDDVPSHAELIAARDRVIERHRKLRVIGAHLASLEYDLNELAQRFDKYENFAVDTSARLVDLMGHGREAVRDFFHAYPDRILFGTDIVSRVPHSKMTQEARDKRLESARFNYHTQRAYFSTDETVELRGQRYEGVKLPQEILDKFFVTNAQAWYPGL